MKSHSEVWGVRTPTHHSGGHMIPPITPSQNIKKLLPSLSGAYFLQNIGYFTIKKVVKN